MTNALARSGYGPAVKEAAFACYLTAEGNVSRAARLLAEKLGDQPCPDRSVVSKWAKEGQWGLQRTQAVSDAMPYITVEQAGRMVVMTDQALDTYENILAGEYNHLPIGIVKEMRQVAQHLLELRGIGTAGARWGGGTDMPALPVVATAEDAALSPHERQRRRLEAGRDE